MIETIPYDDIWNGLRKEWGYRFSAAVVRSNTPCGETILYECGECDLQFFEPAAPGDTEFYRELGENPRYYSPWKWEFDWAGTRLPAAAEVLDVGCGRGDFLAEVAPKVRRAVGIDGSPDAISHAGARGLEAVAGELEELAEGFAGAFTAVCAFHVLEHIPDPVRFVGSLRRCLRPGGSLFVSVPNRLRSGRPAFEPLDFPPHHLTRWSPRSLGRLAIVCGLQVRELALEPVDLSVPRDRLRDRIRSAAEAIPAVGGFIGTWLPKLAWRIVYPGPSAKLYRRLGVFERAGMVGMSMVARLSEPSL
ncbi:MAG: methyltransferase family protein [Deltaproteobacteria bacterium]|nr:methyltransferase family protein [Deltaproteobacteria bacterium]